MSAADTHRIAITPHEGRVRVRFAGRVVADSARALDLKEGAMKPVLYVPREDADMAAYVATTRSTHCPFKGDASYFTLKTEGREAQNAVWTYEDPLPGAAAIAGHLAFYPDQVEIEQN